MGAANAKLSELTAAAIKARDHLTRGEAGEALLALQEAVGRNGVGPHLSSGNGSARNASTWPQAFAELAERHGVRAAFVMLGPAKSGAADAVGIVSGGSDEELVRWLHTQLQVARGTLQQLEHERQRAELIANARPPAPGEAAGGLQVVDTSAASSGADVPATQADPAIDPQE